MSSEGQEAVKKALLDLLRKQGPLTKNKFIALGLPRRDVEAMIKSCVLVRVEHPTKILYTVPDDEE